MKSLYALPLALACFGLAGCANVEFAPATGGAGATDRTLTGTVGFRQSNEGESVTPVLPADAVLTVTVVDRNAPAPEAPMLTSAQMDRPKAAPVVQTLGEQTIKNLGQAPFAFSVDYRASVDDLRRGLTIEASISSGRHLLYTTRDTFSFDANNATDPHAVIVDPE